MRIRHTWRKARRLGYKGGFEEGFKEGALHMLRLQLRIRFGELPAATIARLEAADISQIEQWGDRVISAQTLAEVLGDLS